MIPICYNTHPPPSVLSLLSLQWRLRQHWGEFTQWLIFRLCHRIEKYAENSRITKTKCSVRQTQIIQRWWWWRDECDEVYWQTDSSRHFQCYFTTNLSPLLGHWELGPGVWHFFSITGKWRDGHVVVTCMLDRMNNLSHQGGRNKLSMW